MRILLSNDDGYFVPGLAHLADALADLGEVTMVAPERDRSGASNSGVALYGYFSTMKDEGTIEGVNYSSDINNFSIGVMFSATYN